MLALLLFEAVFFALVVEVFFAAVFPAFGPFEFRGQDGQAGRDDEESGARQDEQSDPEEQDNAADDSDDYFFGCCFQTIARWRETICTPRGCGLITASGDPLLLDGNCGGVFNFGRVGVGEVRADGFEGRSYQWLSDIGNRWGLEHR